MKSSDKKIKGSRPGLALLEWAKVMVKRQMSEIAEEEQKAFYVRKECYVELEE
jgi:hypothetical protein